MVKILSIFSFVVFLAACTDVDTKENVISVGNIVNTGNDGATSEFCSDFSLTKEQAQDFFKNAEQVTARDIHDNYSFLPCFVTGEGYLNEQKCEWKIRAGGTGSIECEDISILMACEDCLPIQE
ncbi:hypothetical protein [Teredinibacter waterburyi]|uniref:hypothetical protein n=1 Tax=Teredinibacter waterburyi TaxID=1500538 RepID=UPI00165F6A9E|nr:hypothetical protein [Teredinibacter waterburyi]